MPLIIPIMKRITRYSERISKIDTHKYVANANLVSETEYGWQDMPQRQITYEE